MMKMMMSSMTTMTRMSSKLGAVSGLFRNRWRQLSVLFSVLVAAGAWSMSTSPQFREITYTFSSPLTITIWALGLVATAGLLLSRYGLFPRYMMFNPVMGMALNMLIGSLVVGTNIPFYFDTLGTIVVAILYGPTLGMATGLGASVLSASYAAHPLAFIPVSMFVGYIFGALAQRRMFRYVATTIVIGLLAGCLSGMITVYPMIYSLGGERDIGSESLLTFYQMVTGNDRLAIICQALTSDSIDKAFTVVAACLLIRFAPAGLRSYAVYPGNAAIADSVFRENSENLGHGDGIRRGLRYMDRGISRYAAWLKPAKSETGE